MYRKKQRRQYYKNGNPIKIILSKGQVHDVTIAPTLIADLKAEVVMADGAYDSDKFREKIKRQGSRACIKPRKNRKEEKYKERHLVRRIATRYDKLAKRYLAFIQVACILIWIK